MALYTKHPSDGNHPHEPLPMCCMGLNRELTTLSPNQCHLNTTHPHPTPPHICPILPRKASAALSSQSWKDSKMNWLARVDLQAPTFLNNPPPSSLPTWENWSRNILQASHSELVSFQNMILIQSPSFKLHCCSHCHYDHVHCC